LVGLDEIVRFGASFSRESWIRSRDEYGCNPGLDGERERHWNDICQLSATDKISVRDSILPGQAGLLRLVSRRGLSKSIASAPNLHRSNLHSGMEKIPGHLAVAALSGACQVFRDIEMENPASTLFDDKSYTNSKGDCRHREKIHGRDDIAMIAQERGPELAFLIGWRQAIEIARNGAFGDLKSKFENFTVNSRRSPRGIFLNHLPNDSSNLGIDSRLAEMLWSGSKAPGQTKASAMPGDYGFRLNND
jgi:hypothetical protein